MSEQRLQSHHVAPASRLGQAVEWLTSWRAEHPGEVRAAQLISAVAEAGINTMTLHRARKLLGLRTRQIAGGWIVGVKPASTGCWLDPPGAGSASHPAPSSLLDLVGAQRHGAPAPSQPECVHHAARIVAVLASPGGDDLGPTGAGLVWWPLDGADEDDATSLGDLDGQRATVYLGVCSDCAATVVTVRTWDPGAWLGVHGSAWSGRWTPFCGDGQHSMTTGPAHRARSGEGAS